MKQRDVVLVNFPFNNHREFKLRPALVASNFRYNKSNILLLFAISTKKVCQGLNRKLYSHDFTKGELEKISYLRFTNIFTVDNNLIVKKIAEIKKESFNEIIKRFTIFLK